MGRTVDALREPGDDDDPRRGGRGRELAGDAEAVSGGAARADDAHRPFERHRDLATDPERIRRMGEVEEPRRIARIGGADRDRGAHARMSRATATSSARIWSEPARSATVRATRSSRW